MSRFRALTLPQAIVIGCGLVAAAIVLTPLVKPYELRIERNVVIRTNRLTGEIVICDRQGCYTYLAAGSHQR